MYIDIYDYLLLPVYLIVFYFIVKKRSVKYTNRQLRNIFLTAFFLRMFGAFAYSMMLQYYYGYGDSFTYYFGSNFLREQVISDISNVKYFFQPAEEVAKWYSIEGPDPYYIGYMGTTSNLFVMKLAAVISFLSFNKFLITSLFFGLFSFIGQWKLFKVFDEVNQGRNQKLMAWAVLYTPSIWFWGSGLMKDSVCLGVTGLLIWLLHKNLVKKEFRLLDIVYLALLVFVLISIKSYAIIILFISLSTIVLLKFIRSIRNFIIKAAVVFTFLILSLTVAFIANFAEQVEILARESKAQVDSYQKNYDAVNAEDERSSGSIEMKEIDPSLGGLLLHSPLAIANCLFRPFIWESRKINILFSSIETTLLILATLFLIIRGRIYGFFKVIFNHEYILFALVVSLLFSLTIGFTTYNFGTMTRYKTILLPFYYFMLVSIYSNLPRSKRQPAKA